MSVIYITKFKPNGLYWTIGAKRCFFDPLLSKHYNRNLDIKL